MRVLRANKEQLAELDGYRSGNSMIAFFPDYAGNMVTSTGVLTDPDFELIRDQLSKLEEIDYVEFPTEDS
jgi:hypothetical protein